MTTETANPTHFRLISALRAIGPYLRESASTEGHYFFDCLSVCVDDKKSPEEREFWGWWMALTAKDPADIQQGFTAHYQFGLYDLAGDWQGIALPDECKDEVTRTQQDFVKKLAKVLEERFALDCGLHDDSEQIG